MCLRIYSCNERDIKPKLENVEKLATQTASTIENEIKPRLENVENTATQTSLAIENDVKPSIQIIAEQHTSLVENYESTNKRIDKCENDIDFNKLQIKNLDNEIQELKKAN